MKFKEHKDISGKLLGYWNENGAYAFPDEPFEKDAKGNVTTQLKSGNSIIPMTDVEIAENAAKTLEIESQAAATQYKKNRADEYPDVRDYIDGVVKGDQEQIDAYIAACKAVKAKYPKPELTSSMVDKPNNEQFMP